VVVCVTPPPVPVIVMVWLPVVAVLLALTVIVEVPEPGAAIELGLKDTVKPLPAPEADKLIDELKPPETAVVIVDVPEARRATLIDVGEALIVKLGFVPVTTRVTVVVSVVLPEVPLTVMAYVPAAVDEATVSVNVEVPAPVMDVGLNARVTPLGCPVALKAIAESKPPVTALVMVVLPALPWTTVTEAGEADRLNPGVEEVPPASAVIRPLPFGLPHPVAKS
jgi:hypothetical protein